MSNGDNGNDDSNNTCDDNGNKVASNKEGDGRAARAMTMATMREMVTAARVIVMATNEGKGGKGKGHDNKGVGQGMAASMKRAMAAATRVVGNKESTGN